MQEIRFSKTIEYLKENETATVKTLAKLNGVSVDTVRRDLDTLERYGILERVRGGAIYRRENLEQHVYQMRRIVHPDKKREIAELVSEVIEDGTTIALFSSSTVVEISKYLTENYKRLTVITNDVDVVEIMSANKDFKIIFIGGQLDLEENCTFGDSCNRGFRLYNADVGIFSVASFSIEEGLSDFRLNLIDGINEFIDISNKVVLAADSAKFNKTACMNVCSIDDIDMLITDRGLDEKDKIEIENRGIEVILPEPL